MSICEEIFGISPIPKILDCKSHLLQAKAYLSPTGAPPEMVCWTSISYRHSTKHPSPALSRKEYPILSKHWQIVYTDTGARLQRKKRSC